MNAISSKKNKITDGLEGFVGFGGFEGFLCVCGGGGDLDG